VRRFDGRTALVTGAASGIGRATCLRLAEEGARLVAADVDLAGAEKTALEIGGLAVACDVSREADVERCVAAAVEHGGGRLDVLAHCAGILRFTHTHEETLEAWNRILAVNLTGTFLACRAALPHLVASRGAIVLMSSTAALKAHPWAAAYSASKGGVQALTLALAVEYGKQGVRVNCVCAGAIETPIKQAFKLPKGADAKLLNRIMPLTRFGPPEDCAAAIAFLSSDDARHVNGEFLRVDDAMCA
jgi:NAD(P)-dependent dehydrogenase (short-subunit alcohol dehydrogenase family)